MLWEERCESAGMCPTLLRSVLGYEGTLEAALLLNLMRPRVAGGERSGGKRLLPIRSSILPIGWTNNPPL